MAPICLNFHLEAEIKCPPSMERRGEVFHSLTWLTPLTSCPLLWHFLWTLELDSREKPDLIRQAPLWALMLLQAAQNQDRALLMGRLSSGILGEENRVGYGTYVMLHVHRARVVLQKADHCQLGWEENKKEVIVSFMPSDRQFPLRLTFLHLAKESTGCLCSGLSSQGCFYSR